MDRRSHVRQSVEAPAQLTALGESPYTVQATLENVSGRGMRLRLEREVPIDTAVRVEFEDCLALGEVCYCQRTGRSWAVGLQIDQMLSHVSMVDALRTRLAGEERSPRPAV